MIKIKKIGIIGAGTMGSGIAQICALKGYETILLDLDQNTINKAKTIIETEKDEEFREIAKKELEVLSAKKNKEVDDLKVLLIPKDPNDEKNVILEIRAGTGGDEAAIFAGDLLRMYQLYSEKNKWSLNVINFNEGSSGGYKEIVCSVEGEDVYGKLKFEASNFNLP